MNEPDVIRGMLGAKAIAVVGLSEDPAKASHYVSAYMQRAGVSDFAGESWAGGAEVLGSRVMRRCGSCRRSRMW